MRRQENCIWYCFCFSPNHKLSKLLSPLGREKERFFWFWFFIVLHGCQDLTQGAVKWKESDLFGALKVYCVLVKYDGKFIKRPRTDLKLETVFSNHSSRTLCLYLETRYPACWGQLETYHQFGTLVPWWLQMPSKFYLLAVSSVLNGYCLGDSQKRSIFSR